MARGEEQALLTPYLPRLAVTWAEETPSQRWRAMDATLVFADISGFTALSERLGRRGRVGTEELTDVLGACFADLLAVAYARGGSLVKFGGDALLLLFEGDDHAGRACASALGMRAALRTAGRLTTSVGSVRLRMSVGIHSGLLHVFRVGGSHRELILTGPGATATVAMESTALAGEILVSPSTAAAVDPRLIGEPRGLAGPAVAGLEGGGYLLRNRAVPGVEGPVPPVPPSSVDLAETVPVALREHLLAGTVESEHRHATVAFAHFDGVDDLLARAGADAVADALDDLVRDIQVAVEDQGVSFLGTDVDRDGGKIVLVAGAPRAVGDEEDRMLRAMHRIASVPRTLGVRVGVNRGHVFVGEVGPPYRRTYTVMGDAVNLAARVMANADTRQVLATADVMERTRTAFEALPLPPFMVKGKANPVEAFAVGAPGDARTIHRPVQLPFIGREPELAVIVDAALAAKQGRGALVEVVGDAGLGKSRLVEEAMQRVDGLTVATVACEPYESTTPYFVLRHLLRSLFPEPLDGPDGGAVLGRLMAGLAPESVPWLPLLAGVVGVEVEPTEEASLLEPRFRRPRTNRVVLQALRGLLPGPAVLFVDNAQWMDDASADTLAAVAAAAAASPWLVCVARRDEPRGYRAPDALGSRTALGPLGPEASGALVAAATRDAPLPPHQREALVLRAGGNPLFLEELLRSRASFDASGALPESVEAVLATQIDRLAPLDRRLLRHAAVLGFSFDSRLLPEVVDDDLREAAAGIGRRLLGFVEPAGRGRLSFRNHCLRDVAYEALPYRRRRELHARAATAIERSAEDGAGDRAAVLSLHFMHAQQYEQCWQYARVGARGAETKYANIEAAELYQRALAASRHLPGLPPEEVAATWEMLGDVSSRAGMFEAGVASYRRARRLRSGDPAALGRLYAKESRIANRQKGSASAIRWIRHGLRVLDGLETPAEVRQRAELRWLFASYCQAGGRHREAVRWCQRALEEAMASENQAALAQAYMVLDWAYNDMGRPDLATNAPKALAIFEELGDLANQAIVLNNLGGFAYYQGRWEEALSFYARGRDANTRIGNVVEAAHGTCNIAEVLIDQGRLDEAEPTLREVAELWQSVGYTTALAFAGRHLGRMAARRGQFDEALRLLEEARATFAAHGYGGEVLEVDAWLAYCLLRRGEVTAAVALLDDALRREAMTGGTALLPMLHRLRGYGYAASDRLVDAWAEFDESLHIARSRQASYEVALTFEAIAVVAQLGGLPADPSADEERESLLTQLGVRETPRPPLLVLDAPAGAG